MTDKVQEIIDNCSLCEHPKELHHMLPKDESSIPEISAESSGQNHVTEISETSERIINAPPALESTEVNTSASALSASQSKSTYDRSYFRNKIWH